MRKISGFFKEFFYFLTHNKKWWILSILFILIALAGFIWFSESIMVPYDYTIW